MSPNLKSESWIRSFKGRFLFFILLTFFLAYSLLTHLSRSPVQVHEIEDWSSGLVSRRSFSGSDENYCHLPNLKAFDKAIAKYVVKEDPIDCTNDTEISYKIRFQINGNGTLLLENPEEMVQFKKCCYQAFDPKRQIQHSKTCIKIETPQQLSRKDEFIGIYCTRKENSTEQKEALPELVDLQHWTPLKPEVEEYLVKVNKMRASRRRSKSKKLEATQVNVILFGLDAVSHLNFQRTMPKSREYLVKTLNATFLNGYTKVGDNTFPNLVPVLTGLDIDELTQRCWPTTKTYFDLCPFIWKNFSSAGYHTSYAEDAVWMGIFNYIKQGFNNPPTHYFLNDFMLTAARTIGHWKHGNAKLCYGPRLGFQILLDNVEKLAEQMGPSRRFFQFTWATSISHDSLNYPGIVDENFLKSLQFLDVKGHLNQTVLIVMSDHGIRYGGIRTTFQGKVEENMPLLYAVFPPWFKTQYSSAYDNFVRNREQLTSPFDLHATLQDLINLDLISNDEIKRREVELSESELISDTPVRGISLFLTIPEKRTCAHAAINDTYCVCHSMQPVPVESPAVINASTAAVQNLNAQLKQFSKCAKLSLRMTMAAHSVELRVNSTDLKEKKPEEYVVLFKTTPGDALFEATMISSENKNGGTKVWSMAGQISRVNEYGNQSYCVDDYNMKKYCYC